MVLVVAHPQLDVTGDGGKTANLALGQLQPVDVGVLVEDDVPVGGKVNEGKARNEPKLVDDGGQRQSGGN